MQTDRQTHTQTQIQAHIYAGTDKETNRGGQTHTHTHTPVPSLPHSQVLLLYFKEYKISALLTDYLLTKECSLVLWKQAKELPEP